MRSSASCLAAAVLAVLPGASGSAGAESSVAVAPETVKPGDPVLVTVTGADAAPKGKVGGAALQFFAVRDGHQAVFAVPLEREPGPLKIALRGLPAAQVEVLAHEFPAADVVVPDEYANPTPEARKRIDKDNKAIRKSFAKATGEAQFHRGFRPPAPGRSTSPFGELRTFNSVAKSRHLGLDVAARSGAAVKAVNDGTVVLVRDCFLPGNVVVVSHGAGIASAYFHLRETSVAEGDVIERGAAVGKAGETGRATGPHVHLSVWVPGGFVDPAAFLRLSLGPFPDAAK
jgi:murein DD-endopeptidase MepM/ murein hydrolase activator NlpD